LKILYIEDVPASAELVKLYVNTLLHTSIQTAPDGTSGLVAVEQNKPDLILLDINLPDINGISLCKQIKASDPNQIVVALSANATENNQRIAKNAGFDDYLIKPIDLTTLNEIIEHYRP